MKIVKIDFKDFKKEFINEHNRMMILLQRAKTRINNQGKKCENYNNRLIEITDASIVNALINCFTYKGLDIIDNMAGEKKIMLGYYFKMITSHIGIFEDFEFYNVALITRYLLESVTGILLNLDSLDSHFSNMDDKQFEKSLKKFNGGITKKIKENLGQEYSDIYKTLSRYIHPISGPLFGLNPKIVSKRNRFIIKSAIKIYIKVTKEIFKICNYKLEIYFENYILQSIESAAKYSIK